MLTRRRLLISLVTVAAGGAVAGWLGLRGRSRNEEAVLRLAESLPKAAGEIGDRYLAGLRARPSRAALARRVAVDLNGSANPAGGGPAAWVAAVVRAEYAAGQTVDVAGWVLARTEARLYALKALKIQGAGARH